MKSIKSKIKKPYWPFLLAGFETVILFLLYWVALGVIWLLGLIPWRNPLSWVIIFLTLLLINFLDLRRHK